MSQGGDILKMRMKPFLKKCLTLLLTLTAVLSVLPAKLTMAVSERATITFDYCYDGAGNTMHYQKTYSHNGRTCAYAGEAITRIYADGENAYCIRPGMPLNTGDVLQKDASALWKGLSQQQRDTTNLVLLYGAQGSMASLSGTESEKVLATSLLIWEVTTGCRKAVAPYDRTDSKFYEGMCADGANSQVAKNYNQIVTSMKNHKAIPSFASVSKDSAAKQMKWDGKNHVLKIQDENKILSKFNFISSNSDVKVSASGNTLTVTSAKAISGQVQVSAVKKVPAVSSSAKLVAYGDPALQDIVTGVENTAAANAYMNVETPYGHLKIVKTSEDGIVEGLKFHITGNGVDQTVTTGKGGTMKVENLVPGTYTVTELTENRYETQKEQKVTVTGGETAQVDFSNTLKRGSLKVTKTSEDGLKEGVKFRLYGTALSGEAVDAYAVTDKSGIATFLNILIAGTKPYTLEEVDTALRYVVPPSQQVAINWKNVINATMTNTLKKFRIHAVKADQETGKAQGDGTLSGAVYGLYDKETLIDTYTTDAEGTFTTKEYTCGDHWTIREITPSEGYLLDETVYPVGAEAKNYTVERNLISRDVAEQVIKGRISVIKHTDDGSTAIETPEEGAEFQVYLKNAGSYEKAKDTEKDLLVCDSNGYTETKDLPYGIYTMHQTKGWEGSERIEDFDVFVSKNGEVYRFLINNRPFESYIKVVKQDAETGKTIPLSGAGFQIYDEAGNLVTMQYTYPEITLLDTFYTGADGCLVTPESLSFGNYTLVEVQAPKGYVLDKTPIPFQVSQDNSSKENSVTIVTVEKQDLAQKGKIVLTKTGEDFSGVQVSGYDAGDKDLAEEKQIYQPVYGVAGKAGAIYEIIASEDIVTPDGTRRTAAGEVVDTVTTDKEGRAQSKELYLGKYKVAEKKAPDGMVLNTEVYEAELLYAGQEVPVTETKVSFYNERQKVRIDLTKVLEQDKLFDLGNKKEVQNIAFGLYAAEDLTASDGSVIPAEGLLEILYCNEEGKAAFLSYLPLGSYYVQEIASDQQYLLSDKKYPAEFTYQGQNALQGAKIGLFPAGTEAFTEKKAFLVSVSDKKGAFIFEDVPYGEYVVREIEAPKGYVLNEKPQFVSVTEHEKVIQVKLTNRRIEGSVRLTKVDAEYPDNKLTGAIFEL